MGSRYIRVLCCHCKLPIGCRDYREYTNDVNGLTFRMHADDMSDCWKEVHDQVSSTFEWLLYRISEEASHEKTVPGRGIVCVPFRSGG